MSKELDKVKLVKGPKGWLERMDPLDNIGVSTFNLIRDAINEGKNELAKDLTDYLFIPEVKLVHDAGCDWLWGWPTFLQKNYGEASVPAAYDGVFQRGWANLPQFNWLKEKPTIKKRGKGGEERLKEYALNTWLNHRMGGHDGALGFTIKEFEDRFELDWDPCVSGGARLRGDPIDGTPSRLGEPYYQGVTQAPHNWSWNKTGVNLYCAHCCIVHEQREAHRNGYLNWIVTPPTAENPKAICRWVSYKEEDDIPEERYAMVGKTKPERTTKKVEPRDATRILRVIRSEQYRPYHFAGLKQAIDAGNKEEALKYLDEISWRTRYLLSVYNVWFWAFYDYVADKYGYNELYHGLRSVDYTFRPPLAPDAPLPTKASVPSAEERVRKAALWGRSDRSGPKNEGSVRIIDEGDKYVMELDPCGSGQTLVLGDPNLPGPSMEPPTSFTATKVQHPVAWGKKGIALFCTRCCVQEEMGAVARTGYLSTVIERDANYKKPCRWLFYKDVDDIPEKYYEEIGAVKPNRQA